MPRESGGNIKMQCGCTFDSEVLRIRIEEEFPVEEGFVIHFYDRGTYRRPRCEICDRIVDESDLLNLFPERHNQIEDLLAFNIRQKRSAERKYYNNYYRY